MAHFKDMQPPDEFKNMRRGEKKDLTPEHPRGPRNGVVKEVLEEGYADIYPHANDKVTAKYTAYHGTEPLPENIFDSSDKDGKDFVFEVLKGQVIRGFEMGVMTMKLGERAMITISPLYAFGKSGAPPKVPADTSVLFDTKILSIEPEDISPDGDKSITKHVLKVGKGWTQVNDGSMVNLHIMGRHEGRVFMEGDKNFQYGEGTDPRHGIPPFIEDLLFEWKQDEKSVVKLKAKHCYGNKGCPEYGIPPDADLEFEVHLKHFEKEKDIWEMDEKERMDQCDMFKQKGNDFFQRKEYPLAKKFYKKVIDNLEFDILMKDEEEERRKKLINVARTNLALVYLKDEKFKKCKDCCNKVLSEEPENTKALFRRAQANYNTKDYKEALQDFQEVLRLDPSNRAASNHVVLCRKKLVASSADEREMYQRMVQVPMDISDSDNSSGMDDISHWDNSMAQGMMTLEQEAEAWDEALPQHGDNNHGNR